MFGFQLQSKLSEGYDTGGIAMAGNPCMNEFKDVFLRGLIFWVPFVQPKAWILHQFLPMIFFTGRESTGSKSIVNDHYKPLSTITDVMIKYDSPVLSSLNAKDRFPKQRFPWYGSRGSRRRDLRTASFMVPFPRRSSRSFRLRARGMAWQGVKMMSFQPFGWSYPSITNQWLGTHG